MRREIESLRSRLSPAEFRGRLKIAPGSGPLSRVMEPWQRADFAALDPAWAVLAGGSEPAAFQRAYIERPRGHSKTSDMAVQIAWILLFAQEAVHGLAAAADRDQASLIANAVRNLARCNPQLCGGLVFRRHEILNPGTGSRLEMISSDVGSSFGVLPDFVICDELCHWNQPDLWFSLFSSAAKKRDCVLVILTNAGVGRGWQWDVREAARTSPDWYFTSLDGPQAPWISPKWLAEQQSLLPPAVYNRLWQNRWQHSDGDFLTLAEAEACRDETLREQSHGQPGRHYIAAIDYAEKHDLTVGVVVRRAGHQIVVERMDVIAPRPEMPTRIDWVEQWIERTAEQFPSVTFIVDEYQLLGTIQRWEQRFDVRRFEFAAGRGNHALALTLRNLIVHRRLAWYRGCGQLPGIDRRDDLETELASLVLRQSTAGRCRIDHLRDGRHHDDRAFALGAACLHALQDDPAALRFEVTPPTHDGDFHWLPIEPPA